MTDDRIQAIEQAIAAQEAAGQPITAEAIWRHVGGRRGTVQAVVRAWRQQQEAAGAVAILVPEAPALDVQPNGSATVPEVMPGAPLERDAAMPADPRPGMMLLGMLPMGAPVPPHEPAPVVPEVPVDVDLLQQHYLRAFEEEQRLGLAQTKHKNRRDQLLATVYPLEVRRDQAAMVDNEAAVNSLDAEIKSVQTAAAAAERERQRLDRPRAAACVAVIEAQQATQAAQDQARRQARVARFAADTG